MKKHIVFPFILCMCMFLTSCGVKMTGVKIQNVGELTTGDRQSLVLDYEFNHDGSDKEKEKVIDKTQLIFSSDNMSVANIVGDGKTILAGTGGTATITVRSLDGTIHDSINVTVLARPKEFSIPHELTLTLGSEEVGTITPTVQPEDFDYSGCEYSSSNEGVVTVGQDGNLTPVSAGTASVYAKLPKLNIERECKVTVIAPIEKITLSKSDASINVGEMVKLSCTTYPETPDTSILQWSTSDSSIATVDASGTVTGVGKGIAFIKVSYKDVYAQLGYTGSEINEFTPYKPRNAVQQEPMNATATMPQAMPQTSVPAPVATQQNAEKLSVVFVMYDSLGKTMQVTDSAQNVMTMFGKMRKALYKNTPEHYALVNDKYTLEAVQSALYSGAPTIPTCRFLSEKQDKECYVCVRRVEVTRYES